MLFFFSLGGYEVDEDDHFEDFTITSKEAGKPWVYGNKAYGTRRGFFGSVYRANKFEYKASQTTFFSKIRTGYVYRKKKALIRGTQNS